MNEKKVAKVVEKFNKALTALNQAALPLDEGLPVMKQKQLNKLAERLYKKAAIVQAAADVLAILTQPEEEAA